MICRADRDGWLLTAQTAHSWLAGSLAAAWGNDRFVAPEPRTAVVLATRLHDIGWSRWDAAPRLHSDGRPVNFLETSLDDTSPVWRRSVNYVRQLNPYAGLLVSMHASVIYRRRLKRQIDPIERQEELRVALAETLAVQTKMQNRLQEQACHKAAIEPMRLNANYRTLRICDLLSLVLCTGPLVEGMIDDVPGGTVEERVELRYFPLDEKTLALEPYPFSLSPLVVGVDARWMPKTRFRGLETFHADLEKASWRFLEFALVPR